MKFCISTYSSGDRALPSGGRRGGSNPPRCVFCIVCAKRNVDKIQWTIGAQERIFDNNMLKLFFKDAYATMIKSEMKNKVKYITNIGGDYEEISGSVDI